jgi:hypothetical protein
VGSTRNQAHHLRGHAEASFGPARTQAMARERLVPLGLRWWQPRGSGGFAMSSATRAASFPDIRVFMTPSSNSESHRHLGGSRWPTSAPDRRDGYRTRGGACRPCSSPSDGTRAPGRSWTPSGASSEIGRRLRAFDRGSVLARDARFHKTASPSSPESSAHSM